VGFAPCRAFHCAPSGACPLRFAALWRDHHAACTARSCIDRGACKGFPPAFVRRRSCPGIRRESPLPPCTSAARARESWRRSFGHLTPFAAHTSTPGASSSSRGPHVRNIRNVRNNGPAVARIADARCPIGCCGRCACCAFRGDGREIPLPGVPEGCDPIDSRLGSVANYRWSRVDLVVIACFS